MLPIRQFLSLQWGTTENLHVWMAHFNEQDTDKDGFVTGQEVFPFFLMSGLPQPTLASVWSLADVGQDGRLDVQVLCTPYLSLIFFRNFVPLWL
jgi:hypothetical protein